LGPPESVQCDKSVIQTPKKSRRVALFHCTVTPEVAGSSPVGPRHRDEEVWGIIPCGGYSVVEKSAIQDLADRIAKEFKPERIILFGSYASGAPSPDSDVDLLVVVPHRDKGWRVATQIRRHVRSPFPMDLIVRTPEQVRERLALGDPFVREIVERGYVLYEAARD